jgi:predicted nucleic acid-binding protein
MPPRTVREARPPRTGKAARRAPAVLIDTNVVLDLILDRAPWSNDAARLFTAANHGVLDAWVSAHAISTVHYIVGRERGRQVAAAAIADLLSFVRVVPLDGAAFQRALTLGLADYEDALQVVAALEVDAQCVVTRDARDFKGASVPVLAPAEALAVLTLR